MWFILSFQKNIVKKFLSANIEVRKISSKFFKHILCINILFAKPTIYSTSLGIEKIVKYFWELKVFFTVILRILYCKKFWFCTVFPLHYVITYICREMVTQPDCSFIVHNNFRNDFDKGVVKKSMYQSQKMGKRRWMVHRIFSQ